MKQHLLVTSSLTCALLALALSGQPSAASHNCWMEDHGGSPGGWAGQCNYPCAGGRYIYAHIYNEDPDADVYAESECSSRFTNCGAQGECDSVNLNPTPTGVVGNGYCYGQSDEFWGSYVHLECIAKTSPSVLGGASTAVYVTIRDAVPEATVCTMSSGEPQCGSVLAVCLPVFGTDVGMLRCGVF